MHFKSLLQYFKKPKQRYIENLWRDKEVALLTKHSKEQVIKPLLHQTIGCKVKLVDGYDTDLLGTFSRDITRRGTQIETARKKANIAMELSSLSCAVASEGSFGVDPYSGIFALNSECVIWIDKENDIEIIATAQSKTNLAHASISNWEECKEFAQRVGFEKHHLIVRPQDRDNQNIKKGITSWGELREAFDWALENSTNNTLFIETDMRAFANPTRMNCIEMATKELVKKLSSLCPACNAPGYDIVDHLTGLECSVCHNPTQEIQADIYGCIKCKERVTLKRTNNNGANPAHCDFCNP